MGRTFLLLLALALMGCEKGYDGQKEAYLNESRDAWKQARTLSGDPLEQIVLLPLCDI